MATGFEDLHILKVAEDIADNIWGEVSNWDDFARDVVGKQITRAVDSVGANIAEAYGRFHFGEKLHFLYYARGSLFETKYWVNRSRKRNLFNKIQAETYAKKLTQLARQLNRFAKSLKSQKQTYKKTVHEPGSEYIVNTETVLFTTSELQWLEQDDTVEPDNLQSPISNLIQGNNHD